MILKNSILSTIRGKLLNVQLCDCLLILQCIDNTGMVTLRVFGNLAGMYGRNNSVDTLICYGYFMLFPKHQPQIGIVSPVKCRTIHPFT